VKGEGALAHRWIFSRLSTVAAQVHDALEHFRFHEACQTIYQFFWGDFCDWYIEWVKPQLVDPDLEIAIPAWRNIFAALDAALRLLHPVMPFLTEELWHRLPQPSGARSISLDKFPEQHAEWTDATADADMGTLQEIIAAARNMRSEMKLDPKHKIPADFSTGNPALRKLVSENMHPLLRLAALSSLQISSGHVDPAGSVIRSTAQFDLRIAYGETVDKPGEIAKLNKEIERLTRDIESKQKRLADETFRSKAPQKVVEDLGALMVERELERKKLQDRLKQLM
jgi:valyl-tRNA synthetase